MMEVQPWADMHSGLRLPVTGSCLTGTRGDRYAIRIRRYRWGILPHDHRRGYEMHDVM